MVGSANRIPADWWKVIAELSIAELSIDETIGTWDESINQETSFSSVSRSRKSLFRLPCFKIHGLDRPALEDQVDR